MITPTDKLSSAEEKQRRAFSKAVELAIKKRAKGSGWRVSQGVLFREFQGWFVSVQTAVWLAKRQTVIELHCKPMALDPIFWEVVEADSNASMPLSFRCFGAWTCRTPPYAEHELPETDAETMAGNVVEWSNTQLALIRDLSVDRFLASLRQHPRAQSYLATIATTMLMSGDYDAAAAICRDAQQRRIECGYLISSIGGPSQSFPELAFAWLEKKRQSLH